MKPKQLILIEGVRVEPPGCYDEIAEAMDWAISNGSEEIEGWEADYLAADMVQHWKHSREDIERSIRIYRERKSNDK